MIVTKVNKKTKPNKLVASHPSVDTEATTSGLRVPHDDINVCAYHLYQKRGSTHGHDMQDWLKAELQITQR
jgi:hypothetical protein